MYTFFRYLYFLISSFQVICRRRLSTARPATPSSASSSSLGMTLCRSECRVYCTDDALAYASASNLPLSEGCALVDTAAGHPTCGGSYFEALEMGLNKWGVKSVVISSDKASIPTQARVVGGVAQTKEVRLIPMRLWNITVFVEMLILNSEVPPLLSATLMDKCVIDLQRNVLTGSWKVRAPCESVTHTLRSKHRSVDV